VEVVNLELRSGPGQRIYANGLLPTQGRANFDLEVENFAIENVAELLQSDLSMAGRVTHTDAPPYDVVLGVAPANQQDPLSIALKIDGEQDHAALHLPPLALSDWWAGMHAGKPPSLPPVQGTIDAAQVDVGSVHIKGLRVRATPGSPAAAGSSAPPPASTAAAPARSP